MTISASRLAALRARLVADGLDGFIVPLTDEHLSEYVGDYARRLEWLTGFTGSAGTAVVLADRAAIFVDGRYTVQVRAEVDATLFEICGVPRTSPARWLAANAGAGARIGHDPFLTSRPFLDELARTAPEVISVAVRSNPVDGCWADRPAPSMAPATILDDGFAGEPADSKRRRLGEAIGAAGAELAVIAALDSVAWLFNIRGADVPRTPVVRAFALVATDGRATLFIAPEKVPGDVRAHLGPDVTLAPYEALVPTLAGLGGRRVLVDPGTAVVAITNALAEAGALLVEARDPVILMKACKNEAERAGTRAAHVRDGMAVARFLALVDREAAAGTLDELSAQAKLEAIRRESNLLKDLSFDSISAFGPNAALPHYRSAPASNRQLAGDGLYLIDSGGQYPDGTTDITRTVAIGTPTPEMRDRFTRVLKGHIALAVARFPRGTRGGQLDILARQFLWAAGLDYAHGTGHGVGSYLSVHEGPQRIAAAAGAPGIDEPLLPGMILSNEPGFYREGAYGIRVENLVLVVEDSRPGDSEPMLAFETLTLAPIDTRLVEPMLMRADEIAWLNAYHARVRAALAPGLQGADRAWLEAATAPLPLPMAAAA
jgi:Xaa-Pro aminopeptidase